MKKIWVKAPTAAMNVKVCSEFGGSRRLKDLTILKILEAPFVLVSSLQDDDPNVVFHGI